jgi:hypothetical protein
VNITKETARRALALHADGDTWARCAYECEITLQSIAPYTDRATSAVWRLCRWLERRPEDAAERDMAALQRIAGVVP